MELTLHLDYLEKKCNISTSMSCWSDSKELKREQQRINVTFCANGQLSNFKDSFSVYFLFILSLFTKPVLI